jgi:hypothetical protein
MTRLHIGRYAQLLTQSGAYRGVSRDGRYVSPFSWFVIVVIGSLYDNPNPNSTDRPRTRSDSQHLNLVATGIAQECPVGQITSLNLHLLNCDSTKFFPIF